MERAYEWLQAALGIGLESRDLGVVQMGLRAAIVFMVTVAIVQLGKKRFLGRATAFDVILGIMLGSIVSRAVTGNAPLVPALGAAAVLMLMHWLFSSIALRWHGFGALVKGRARLLVQDGRTQDEAMRASHMTEHDLWEDLRSKSVSSLAEVKEARLERSGQLSVIKAKPEPKVVEVAVRDGVQTVRIEISG
ncbi:MAG: hypothetical protein QOJ22_1200 [Thermoleophilaceae bacterium]|nr:hypothetical protein [Thermoleophilaceae bacterium]